MNPPFARVEPLVLHGERQQRGISTSASIDDVWATLADFGEIAAWAANVDHSTLLTHLPVGVGTKRRIQSGRLALVETIVAWAPPATGLGPTFEARLAYSIHGLPAVLRSVHNAWLVTDGGRRRTIELSTTVDAGARPPQVALARLVARRIARTSDEMLTGLSSYFDTKDGSS